MNKKLVGYWVTTALFCLVMTADGVASLLRIEQQQAIMEVLGYPPYLMTLLGILKLLGVVALLAPGFARLKEWAYAGFSFDLIGAAFSFAAAGDPTPACIAPPLLILAVVAVSYVLRPESRRL